MTVEELIAKLKEMPPACPVYYYEGPHPNKVMSCRETFFCDNEEKESVVVID